MIDWQQIDTVLLDMDGTLLDLHFDNYFWLQHLPFHLAEVRGISEKAALSLLKEKVDSHRGTLKWYCLDFWSDTLGVNIRALKEELRHLICTRPQVEAFLTQLQQQGKKSVLITNAHRQSLDLKLEVTEIDRLMDIVISSHDFQSPKEDQSFWEQLQAFEPFDPERTLFIDDTVDILRSAERYGIRHLLCVHQPDSKTPRRIEEFPAIDHFSDIMPVTT